MAERTPERPPPDGRAAAREPEVDLARARWRSSSRGAGEVQVAFVEGYVALRHGRDPGGPALVFDPDEWHAFVLGARRGEFDLT